MRSKWYDEFQGYGKWIAEHQRFWWPVFSFSFMIGLWLVGMSILLVFPALGEKSIGHITGYGEKCDTNSNGVTDCEPYSIVTFPDAEERTHWTSENPNLPLGKEMLVNYLPWGNPPIAAFTYDVNAGEEPEGSLIAGILLFVIILFMIGLIWVTRSSFLRHQIKLTEAQQVEWWSVHMDIVANENDPILKSIVKKLQCGEIISQGHRINPFRFAMKNPPGKLDAFGLGIGGLIWSGLSIGLDLSFTGWSLSVKSMLLNTGLSLVGLGMMIPFVINIFLGISSRLVVTNMRKILFLGNTYLYGDFESAKT